jgi:hypothetical protein
MRTRLLPLIPLTALVVALGACGDNDDDKRGVDGQPDESGLASVELTNDLGCGYGFARADDAGETLLSIHHRAGADRPARTVTLPSPDWDAEVTVGTHLDANWCSDVIDDPQAEVDQTWAIVEGTLQFEDQVPPVDGTPADQPVAAELTGVVVESPDGEQVELGAISLRNESWGFFAG